MATLNETPGRRPPRLPLLHLHGVVTRYKNELFKRKEEVEVDEKDSETPSKDDKIADLELKCLLSLQKRKDRALSGVLLESSDFLSPRSGCLTPLSSARGPIIGAQQRFPQERDCISLPNSSRESATSKDRSLGPPLQDSLRSRFCKHPMPRENSELFQIESTDLQIKGPLEQKLIEQGITPVYEPKCCQGKQQCSLLPLIPDVSDLRVFLVCPGPKAGGHIQCHIRRVVSTYKLYPRYKLYLTKGNIFLLSARKRKRSKCSNYILSLDEEDVSKRTGNYFGNVRSNFIGTQFWFYDKGETPPIISDKSCYNRPMDRVELGAVMFESNVFGIKGPRKITAVIPAFDPDDRPYVFDPQLQSSPSILHRYRNGYDHDKMVIMRSKLPQWNQQLRSYCLNFHGRATHASVKNFQLVTEFDNEHVLLQLGKVGKNYFTMDYCYPLSALQMHRRIGLRLGALCGGRIMVQMGLSYNSWLFAFLAKL